MKACEAVDTCLGKLIASVKRQNGALLVTADHGNCEKMWDDVKDEPHTAHTLNQVHIIPPPSPPPSFPPP
jgi:2,3-bisphosphoglycerate-independent phosphoglycerate mutase